MRNAITATALALLVVVVPLQAQEERSGAGKAFVVVVAGIGIVTACTAYVLAERYQGWCEGAGGDYERVPSTGAPGRPGSGWACVNPELGDRPERPDTRPIDECKAFLQSIGVGGSG